MSSTCSRSECTVAETGICLLNNPPESCPERIGSVGATIVPAETLTISSLPTPTERPRFPHSLTLSPDEIEPQTKRRYHHLIAILGPPDAGKTAILVSLYLLLANNKLDGYQIADSATMMAFDEISRGTRRWNKGSAPEQMTTHTELPDERTPGFLHLRLRRGSDAKLIDIILPDLPGEWTDSFIDQSRTDRLLFLQGSDAIWVTLDGEELTRLRQQVLHRTHLLFQRIAKFLAPTIPPVILVISHLDRGQPEQRNVDSLIGEANRHGIHLTIVNVASFSDVKAVQPGTGLLQLLAESLRAESDLSSPPFWPQSSLASQARFALRFRSQDSEAQ
jgi:hypothetical protein